LDLRRKKKEESVVRLPYLILSNKIKLLFFVVENSKNLLFTKLRKGYVCALNMRIINHLLRNKLEETFFFHLFIF
jgi:hypothetical protein